MLRWINLWLCIFVGHKWITAKYSHGYTSCLRCHTNNGKGVVKGVEYDARCL
jgi:hypothetical protein